MEWYSNNLNGIRKTFYVGFLIIIGAGVLWGHIDLRNWSYILTLASLAIFIDLAVLQTPNILKIGNAELQQDDAKLRKTIKDNEKIVRQSMHKVEQHSEVITHSDAHFDQININPLIWDEYRKALKQYLRLYTDTFHFSINIQSFMHDDDDIDKMKHQIRTAVTQSERFHEMSLAEEIRYNLIEALSKSETFIIKEENVVVIPYFSSHHSFIISLQSNEATTVNGIDASHIVNLTTVFDWFMQ